MRRIEHDAACRRPANCVPIKRAGSPASSPKMRRLMASIAGRRSRPARTISGAPSDRRGPFELIRTLAWPGAWPVFGMSQIGAIWWSTQRHRGRVQQGGGGLSWSPRLGLSRSPKRHATDRRAWADDRQKRMQGRFAPPFIPVWLEPWWNQTTPRTGSCGLNP
jgi:hypothetical protein